MCIDLYEIQGATTEGYPDLASVCTRCRMEPAPIDEGDGTGNNRLQESINNEWGLPDNEDMKWGSDGEEEVDDNDAPFNTVTMSDGSLEEDEEDKGVSLAATA